MKWKMGRRKKASFAEAQYAEAVSACEASEKTRAEVIRKLCLLADGGPNIIVRDGRGEYAYGSVTWQRKTSVPLSFSTGKKCWEAINALRDEGLDLVFPE